MFNVWHWNDYCGCIPVIAWTYVLCLVYLRWWLKNFWQIFFYFRKKFIVRQVGEVAELGLKWTWPPCAKIYSGIQNSDYSFEVFLFGNVFFERCVVGLIGNDNLLAQNARNGNTIRLRIVDECNFRQGSSTSASASFGASFVVVAKIRYNCF